MDDHAQRSRAHGELGGDDAIRRAGVEISARMIVSYDHARGAELESPAQDFPRVERSVVNRAWGARFGREQLVARIKEEHRDLLPRRVGEQHAEVGNDGRIVREDRSALQIDLQAVEQRCPDRRQMFGCARPCHEQTPQRMSIGGERLGCGAECVEEKVGASGRVGRGYRLEKVRQDGSTPRATSRRRCR